MGDREMLQARMRELVSEDICLAFSGGVDSSLLLKVAADAAAETGKRCMRSHLTAGSTPPVI